jgi:hypothetical protein
MNEEQLQENVVILMRSHGRLDVCWAAIPNGEQRRRSTGAKLKRAGVVAGAPDLFFLIDGVFHGVELKVVDGIHTKNQKDFGSWITTAGGCYHVCYGLSQAINCLKAIGALRKDVMVITPTPGAGRAPRKRK